MQPHSGLVSQPNPCVECIHEVLGGKYRLSCASTRARDHGPPTLITDLAVQRDPWPGYTMLASSKAPGLSELTDSGRHRSPTLSRLTQVRKLSDKLALCDATTCF